MRKHIKNIQKLAVFALICGAGTLYSCHPGYESELYTYPDITVSGYSPEGGYPGSVVKITGSNFGDRPEAAKVSFNGELATEFMNYQDDMMEVVVPSGAQTGRLSVQVWTHLKDSIGFYEVKALPKMENIMFPSENGENIAIPGDVITIVGTGFGTDPSAIQVSFNGTPAAIIPPLVDDQLQVTVPEGYQTGYIELSIGGSTIVSNTVMINPVASGDLTPYFLSNTGEIESGGLFLPKYDDMVPENARWGTQGVPWITNNSLKNKTNGDGVKIGGWAREPWSGPHGYLCFETWGNTGILDGKVYQQTAFELPAGNYTLSYKYFSENKPVSSVHVVVAAGEGIPSLTDLGGAIGYAGTWNHTPDDATSPSSGDVIEELSFSLDQSQKVSIGLLVNMAGADVRAGYFKMYWLKLVKN